jgi:hypothetical protein
MYSLGLKGPGTLFPPIVMSLKMQLPAGPLLLHAGKFSFAPNRYNV